MLLELFLGNYFKRGLGEFWKKHFSAQLVTHSLKLNKTW